MKTPFISIYRATFPNGKCYVGQTSRPLPTRIQEHMREATGGYHNNKLFGRALVKHGDGVKWEVVAAVIPEWADAAEQNAILACRALAPHGYNLKEGGDRAAYSDESKAKMSAIAKGKPKSPEHCAALSAAKTGKKLSAEHRAAIGKGGKGRKHSAATRKKIGAASVGRTHSRRKKSCP